MRAINHKLVRDLWHIRSQVSAIALVVAAGVSMYVLMLSAYASLGLTQATYYERYRFAHVFASLVRAPASLAEDLSAIPGVRAAETRIVVNVTLDLAGRTEPASGRLISWPEGRRPRVNDVFLASGRLPEPGRDDEVLASQTFADANELEPGDSLAALINGRRRVLRIAGLALSPEYVYAIRPGELVADDERFGILWMNERALGAAFQMEGAFNDVALLLGPDASDQAVMARVDRLLEPYGGLGAIPRDQQLSHFFLKGELEQLDNMGRIVPIVFLTVAAFLINVVLTRLVAVEREQVAALKALGYSNREVGLHYLKWGIVVATVGAVVGIAAGAWLGHGMTALYTDFFHFPLLEYQLPPLVVVQGVLVAFFSAILGTLGAVRRVVRLPPAEAMRPEAPARYRETWIERVGLRRWLSQPGRMVLRNMMRRPGRAAMSLLAIAVSGSLLVVGLFTLDSIDTMLDAQFYHAQRYDALVTFVEPLSASASGEVDRLPGVRLAEGFRGIAARMRAGPRDRYVSVLGVDGRGELLQVLDGFEDVVALPPEGLVMSRKLGELLAVGPGDVVELDVLEGQRPVKQATVSRLLDDYMGINVYMDRDAVHRLMREERVLSGAFLRTDPAGARALYQRLRETPAVAGVAVKQTMLDNFQETLDQSIGISRTVMIVFASIIAFGVVYNTARVALSERARELATLRVLGFTRAEIARILFGEWAVVTLVAQPLGMIIGTVLAALVVRAFNTEVYRLPLLIAPRTYLFAMTTVIVAAVVSSLVVRRRLDHLDLIAVLKTRE
ncbi:MAG TPA: FtsX-like permease family protein [Vicinamibacterales bacterium]|nr:FtsX-like permease family protein [Vicinamibacterales bacterium]